MAIPVKSLKAKLKISPERQEKISQRAQQLIAQEITLRDVRRGRELAQEHLTEILGIGQDGA